MTLKEIIALTYAYYSRGQALPDTVLAMYAKDLEDLPEHDCIMAYDRYRRNPANKTFPLPASIREMVAPEAYVSIETKARTIAARIIGAVSQFGWSNAREAQAFIGPEGWRVVQTQGGWSHICQNLGVTMQPTTFQAQLRDQLEGELRYGIGAVEESISALPSESVRSGKLEPVGKVLELMSARRAIGDGSDNDDLPPAG